MPTDALCLGTSKSRGFLFGNCQTFFRTSSLDRKPKSHTCTLRSTYSAQGGGGNCERSAGRCSAAQSEFDAPRKIFQPKSLIFRLKDFAGMEKVRFLALISYFSASFYCGKEAKTLVGTSPYSGILG